MTAPAQVTLRSVEKILTGGGHALTVHFVRDRVAIVPELILSVLSYHNGQSMALDPELTMQMFNSDIVCGTWTFCLN